MKRRTPPTECKIFRPLVRVCKAVKPAYDSQVGFMLLHCCRTKSQIVRQIERCVEIQVYQLGKEGFCNPFQVIHRSGEQSSPAKIQRLTNNVTV